MRRSRSIRLIIEFGDSETYKHSIKAVREAQKAMSKNKKAVVCHTPWTLDGSTSKGQTMINRAIRLTLRAFNNECEAAIANVRWNNANAMIKRIENAKKQIDKANASHKIEVTDDFLVLKLNELRLTHEYREKLKLERDQRAEHARLEREERRLLREAEDARKEEDRYQALLEKARAEAGVVSSEEQKARIRELEQQLAEAHEKTERARAMAEKTKSGFVYIISNIGSFGEDVVKIGLTRRLDPTDRVRELGDASVPFVFDTHAMIYSVEAPALEAGLHAEFGDRRINMANMRKEFFRVSLDEVEEAHEKTERARAMAEKTKSGFVYIISNIGSFGEDVVKIGLTRRLDPTDRVRELGDASVPFVFDTHAMIYSVEAPALEAGLHAEFGDRRINMANMRKEFFRVSLDEVEEAVKRLAPDAEFHKDIEAQDFHETLARRQEKVALEEANKALEFPERI